MSTGALWWAEDPQACPSVKHRWAVRYADGAVFPADSREEAERIVAEAPGLLEHYADCAGAELVQCSITTPCWTDGSDPWADYDWPAPRAGTVHRAEWAVRYADGEVFAESSHDDARQSMMVAAVAAIDPQQCRPEFAGAHIAYRVVSTTAWTPVALH